MRLRGGATREITWTPDPLGYEVYKTREEVVAEIDRLLNDHTDGEIAGILNERGYRSGYGHAFTRKLVFTVRRNYGLKSRYERLRERGLLRRDEIADRLGVSNSTVWKWHREGLVHGHICNDKPQYLYEIPDQPPTKQPGRLFSQRQSISRPCLDRNSRGVV